MQCKCVVDKNGFYKTLVAVNDEGQVLYYELKDGEELIDAIAPTPKMHEKSEGFINAKWNGENWVEGAVATEIEKWNTEHPSPIIPEDKPTEQEILRADVDYLLMMQEG